MMKNQNSTKILPVALVFLLAACGPGLGKGDKLAEKGDLEGAAKIYRIVYEKKTTNKVALVKLGRTLFLLNEAKKRDGKEVTGAEWKETYELLDRAKQVEPIPPEVDPIKDYELADSAFEAGKALAAEGAHKEAIKIFLRGKDAGKSGARINEHLALSLEATGDKAGAVDAMLKAVDGNTTEGLLVRNGAFLAKEAGLMADCHELMLVGEALEPAGFKFYKFKEIQLMCSRSYFFLTTGLLETIFTTRRLEAQRVKQWKDDEALMTKNWEHYQKRRPEEVLKEDRAYFIRILYHLYIAHGMAHVLLCEFDVAKQWWENADLVDKERIVAPKNVSEETVQDELTWPQQNTKLLESLLKKK